MSQEKGTAQLDRQCFLIISKELEHGGELAHRDVTNEQIQFDQQNQAFQEAHLTMSKARLDLAVVSSLTLEQL